jgi:hypothetical protein
MKPVIITICLILLVPVACACGAELLVPSQYPTIQAAVDSAASGDTVIIAPGTYTGTGNWDIDLHGRTITVQSANPDDPDVVAGTIIDCYNPVSNGYHRGFTFQSIYSSETIVSGLTIIDGQTGPMDGGSNLTDGGGMRFMNCGSPTIKNCVITYNNASRGGGISCTNNAAPVFINCTISENWSVQNGGGVYCSNSTPKFFDCTIIGNFAIGSGSSGLNYGGGIYLEGNNNPILENTQIIDNLAAGDGGGIYSQYGLNIKHCIISGNISERSGGAICTIGPMTLSNCIITGNSASLYGGAVYAAGDTIITNCTFSGNRMYQANNGTIHTGGEVLKITNTIIWEDNAIQYGCVTTIAMYCDIQGTRNYYDGTGNIVTDPCFVAPGKWLDNNSWVSGDYHLSIDSGCINMGDPNNNAYKNDRDIDSEPRIKFGRVDIGADEANTNPMDLDQDGSVDFKDFARFADAWLWQAKWVGPGVGLVAYYPFNGNANDASGNRNNGTVVGAAFETYGAGDTMALHFHGNTSSYVLVRRSASLEPVDAISISMWVKGVPGQACGYGWGTILRKADDCQPGYFIRGCNGDSSFWLSGANPCSGADYWTTGFPLFTGTNWQHIVATYSRSDGLMKSYENGVLVNQTPLASQLLHSGNLYIGGAIVRGDDGGFNGLINEVRIYNRALSASEVQKLYLSGSGSHP